MTSFLKTTAQGIESLRIQGASAIAKAAVLAMKDVVHHSKAKKPNVLLYELHDAQRQLIRTRPTEPYLRNSLRSCLYKLVIGSVPSLRESALMRMQWTLKLLERTNQEIAEIGARRIPKGGIVYTHCHSSTVVAVLREAKRQGKSFMVHNTETRPSFQGRITATQLSKLGIKVRHYVDSAARLALKDADVMLIGADAITAEGKVANKVGSELIAEAAQRIGVPLYVCTPSLKFAPHTLFGFEEVLEERHATEVWKNPPNGVSVDNHVFEFVQPELITGIISELGIFKPELLFSEIRRNYPWVFPR